jgi:hypothetical protein
VFEFCGYTETGAAFIQYVDATPPSSPQWQSVVASIQSILKILGIPEKLLPESEW